MAKKEVHLFNGNIIVVVENEYLVEEKELPMGIDPTVDWLGNFKVTLPGKTYERLPDKYEIQVPWRSKKLVFWDTTSSIKVDFDKANHDLHEVHKKGNRFKSAKLDLADPPVGWDP